MSSNPTVTIGVLNYNGESFLRESIPALLKLEYKPIEIIVFDNGSTDKSLDYLNTIPQVRVIKSDSNLGYGEGKNRIVKNSNSEYILLIDNDIVLKAVNVIDQLQSFYQIQDNISFLSAPLIDRGSATTEHYGLYYTSIKKNLQILNFSTMKPYAPGGFIGGFVFFKRCVFVELGGFDTIYPFNIDDYDLSARSWIMGYKIYILPMVDIEHIGISTRTSKKSWCWKNQYAFSGFSRMVLKNYNLKNVLLWIPLVFTWQFYKSLKASFRFRSPFPIFSFFTSSYYFVRDLPDTLKRRSRMQSQRKIIKDIFLYIKPKI